MKFVEPHTIEEATNLLSTNSGQMRVLSGGTALIMMIRQGLIAPETLVSLGSVAGLRGIRLDNNRVWIGAGTTLSEIASSPEVCSSIPSLASACRQVGNIRVRNMATIGGNLAEADYASDPPALLTCLDAVCDVEGYKGTRRVAVGDLLTGFYSTSLEPSDIITGISIPRKVGRQSTYRKFVSRSSEDRPCVGVAASVDREGSEVTGLQVVVGAVASRPQRFDHITRSAIGGTLELDNCQSIAKAYAAAIDPIGDARGSVWYRRRMIEVFVSRALSDLSMPIRF